VDATVTITYRTPGGATVTRTRTVPARQRVTVRVADEAAALAATAFWATVSSTRPIVSERSMYWPGPTQTWADGHSSAGLTTPATKWGLAEGSSGGPLDFDTYYLVANPSATAANVTLTFLRAPGTPPLVKSVTIDPGARLTFSVTAQAPELLGESFGVIVTSTNGVPILLERSQYWSRAGTWFIGGANDIGIRVP
jgi:hypothetical protein